MRALDPVDVALDLLAECPADPAEVRHDHLERLEAAAEVVARQTVATVEHMRALAVRLGADDCDIRDALEERDVLVARMERHRRADELLTDYLAHAAQARGLHLGEAIPSLPTEEPPQ